MGLSELVILVGIASSPALVVSVCLLAYNLRAARVDAGRNLAFSMMEQLTSADFAARRWKMHRSVGAAAASARKAFDNSLEEFESRAFAYQYELIGQMVRSGTLDYPPVRGFLRYSLVGGRNAFHPLNTQLRDRYPGVRGPGRVFASWPRET